MAKFLDARHGGRWKIDLISDDASLFLLVADLHRDGKMGLCLDPKPDGSGGGNMSLADMWLQATHIDD